MGRGLDSNWVSWATENIERGCDPAEIRSTLKREGLSNKAIKKVMAQSQIHELDESVRERLGEPNPKALEAAALKSQFVDGQDIEGLSNSDNNTSADYLALTQPRVTQANSHPDVRKIENDKIQLYTWDDFLTSAECAALQKIIKKHLRPSTVTVNNGDDQFRTSSTCDLSLIKDPFIDEIDQKISKALGIYQAYSEGIQAQRYNVNQEFKAHTDYFEPGSVEYADFAEAQGQRTWTFMIYLQETKKGGGTKFVNIDKTFYPKLGQAVIWNNLDSRGRPNGDTIHHGMKVLSGSKEIITKWYRDRGEGAMLYPLTGAEGEAARRKKKRFGLF